MAGAQHAQAHPRTKKLLWSTVTKRTEMGEASNAIKMIETSLFTLMRTFISVLSEETVNAIIGNDDDDGD